jgi:uncharacterized membrane protein YkvA (DUF1232 family)
MPDDLKSPPRRSWLAALSPFALLARAARTVVRQAYTVRNLFGDEDTPTWAKGQAIGAVFYLFFPLDFVPDVLPLIGYTDDTAMLAAALATLVYYLKPEHRQAAREQAVALLGGPKS